jgi:hypothetical protein
MKSERTIASFSLTAREEDNSAALLYQGRCPFWLAGDLPFSEGGRPCRRIQDNPYRDSFPIERKIATAVIMPCSPENEAYV